MFCAISFALYMLGYWNYTPDQQGASKGHTFSDYGVGHAKELCGDPMSGRYCELVCETDGKKTDFQAKGDAVRSWAMFEFTLYTLEVALIAMGIVAAWQAGSGVPCDDSAPYPTRTKNTILVITIFMAAWCLVPVLRAVVVFGAASAFKDGVTNLQAYLLNERFDEKGEYLEGDGPECTQKWLDEVDKAFTRFYWIPQIVGLIGYVIYSAFAVYNAFLVKQDLLYHPSRISSTAIASSVPHAVATSMPAVATAMPTAVAVAHPMPVEEVPVGIQVEQVSKASSTPEV